MALHRASLISSALRPFLSSLAHSSQHCRTFVTCQALFKELGNGQQTGRIPEIGTCFLGSLQIPEHHLLASLNLPGLWAEHQTSSLVVLEHSSSPCQTEETEVPSTNELDTTCVLMHVTEAILLAFDVDVVLPGQAKVELALFKAVSFSWLL